MAPLEFASRTEKDSRMQCNSWGGSLERLSFWERVLEKTRRGEVVIVEACDGAEREDESYLEGEGGRQAVAEGGGSVCALLNVCSEDGLEGVETISCSSSSSDTVYACLSFEGEVIGEVPLLFVGGVAGLPLMIVGEPGEAGRRNGDERGELKEDLYEACSGQV